LAGNLVKPLGLNGGSIAMDSGKMRKNQFITVDFRYEFRESQAAFCKHFQYQKSRFGVFKTGY
jgi:hypothetical protein